MRSAYFAALLLILNLPSFCQNSPELDISGQKVDTTKYGYITFTDKTLEIKIDGVIIENTDRIKVPAGKREFTVWDKRDSSLAEERHFIKQNTSFTIDFNKKQFTSRNILASALFPGVGQTLDGYWGKGLALGIPALTCIVLYIDAAIGYNKEFNHFLDINRGLYYLLGEEISRIKRYESKQRLGELQDKKDKYATYTAVIYFLNLLDAAIFHSVKNDLEFSSSPVILPGNDVGVQLNFNLKLD